MEIVRCKACGYISAKNKIGDVCPACGVPKTAFEPYTENISAKRKMILDLNLHPIAVHFPQALAVLIPFLIIMSTAIDIKLPELHHELLTTARILSIILPFTVIPAAVCGIIDGKTRFKKITTPILIKKIIAGSLLFLLSTLAALVSLTMWMEYPARIYVLAICTGCILCEIFLGEMGKTLMNARLPG